MMNEVAPAPSRSLSSVSLKPYDAGGIRNDWMLAESTSVSAAAPLRGAPYAPLDHAGLRDDVGLLEGDERLLVAAQRGVGRVEVKRTARV